MKDDLATCPAHRFRTRRFTLRSAREQSQTGSNANEREEYENLEDAGLTLQPTDIAGDLLDVGRSDSVDLRHIAELPTVGFDAGGGGALKRRVSVMVGLINLMNERRTLLCPNALRTMAGRTMSLKFGFSRLQFHRNRGSPHGRVWLRRVTGDDGKHPRESQQGQVQHGRPRSHCGSPCPRAGLVK